MSTREMVKGHIQCTLWKLNGLWEFFVRGIWDFWGGVGGTRVKDRVMETMKGGERGLGREVRSLWREFFFLLCALSLTLLVPERFRKKERHIHTQKEKQRGVSCKQIHWFLTDLLKQTFENYASEPGFRIHIRFNQACRSFIMKTLFIYCR